MKKYYKDLDIIRFISCIAVLLYHLNILKGGYLAVCTFFVLSGYLSTTSLFKKDKVNLKDYYLNRIKHIYLPLIIVVFTSIFIISFIPNVNWISMKPETTSVILGYNNYWQINANMDYFARHINSPFMHLWYIAILLQFELVFPFIFILLKKIKDKVNKHIPIIILLLLTIVSTGYFYFMSIIDTNIMNVYYNTLTRVFALVFGVCLGFIHNTYRPLYFRNKVFNRIIFYLYLVILVLLFIFIDSKSLLFSIIMIITTLITCRLIDYSVSNENDLNIIDKIIKYLSSVSYEVYLVQYPVIFIFQYIILKDYFKLPIIIIITFVISIILHISLDKKKKFYKYILLVLFSISSLLGIYKFIIEKDHTEEMNALKKQMNENVLVMKEKKEEYAKKLKEENDKFEEELKKLDDGSNNLEEVINNLPIVGIGDSVMLGAVPRLYDTFTNGYFDAKVSRTDYEANDILKNLSNNGLLSDTVVIHLGTNGQCGNRCRDQIMNTLGNRKVFWVTVTNDYDVHVNSGLKEYAKNHGSYIIDWEEAGRGHPEYFAADKIHLNSSGITAYCKLVYDTIYNAYKNDFEKRKEEMINKHNDLLKSKFTFYGNDLLLNAYNYLEEEYSDAEFVIDKDFTYDKLINKLKSSNYNIVLVFDNTFNLNTIQYKNIIDLYKDKNIYILDINDSINLNYDNLNIIKFKYRDYLMVDGIHLTDDGNKELSNLLKQIKRD